MNECPTRVRTGTPPCSRITSGTARERMRFVHDGLARMTIQNPGGDDRGRGGATHGLTGVVDEKHAIGVAVECEPDIGAEVEHRALEVFDVLGLDRIRGMIRKRAVELTEEHRERERQPFEHFRDDEPAHAVRGVGDDHERPQCFGIDERPHVIAEGLEEVDVLHPARHLAARRDAGRDHLLDLRGPGPLPPGAARRHSLMPLYCAGL